MEVEMGLRCSRCNKLLLSISSQYCFTCEYVLAKEQSDKNEWEEKVAAMEEERKVWWKNRQELKAKDPSLKFCTECQYYHDLEVVGLRDGHICHYIFQDIDWLRAKWQKLPTNVAAK
jgi:hypothetical protein